MGQMVQSALAEVIPYSGISIRSMTSFESLLRFLNASGTASSGAEYLPLRQFSGTYQCATIKSIWV